jgi:electron transfer flavoprotein alpha subunit
MEEKVKQKKKPRGKAVLIQGKCITCGAKCQAACPTDAVEMLESGEPKFLDEKCIGCRKCVKICPANAIEIILPPGTQEIPSEIESEGLGDEVGEEPKKDGLNVFAWKGVWVFVEQTDGVAHSVSWELLGVGRTLAQDLGVELSAFILGSNIKALADEAYGYGAEKVYLMDDSILSHYRTDPYLQGSISLIRKYKPEIVLMGATGLGRDLAGAVATELNTGLTADCTGLTIDKKMRLLEQTRPAFGGNIMATILTETARPQMASVRPHVMSKQDFMPGRKGETIVEPFTLPEREVASKVLEVINLISESSVDIAAANIIVSGGRGMLNADNFKLLQNFADLLGGVVGCSRSAVDAGWIPQDRQVGQTGKTVKPKLYIACGISGAIQHLVGMQNADYIIAINKDKTAPIFEVAHLGIVGDVFQIVPAIIEKLKERGAKSMMCE